MHYCLSRVVLLDFALLIAENTVRRPSQVKYVLDPGHEFRAT
jgi:hypothetical protein